VKTQNLNPWKMAVRVRCFCLCLGLILDTIAITPSRAQCGGTLPTRSYDTVITGPGFGNYTFSFPRWNADSGTLMSVKINAIVSLKYGFTLRNADVVPSIYSVTAGREDQISSPAMAVPYDNIAQQSVGVFSLAPGNQVTQAPFSFLNNYNNSDSIVGAMSNFIGSGNLSFAYSPITYTDVHANNNASYSFSATAQDTVHFILTYTYCGAGLLAASLTRFDAAAYGPGSVALSWTAVNEEAGRVYEIDESSYGVQFSAAGLLASTASGTGVSDYRFICNLPAASPGKWYFRLKIMDPGASPIYSIVKTVNMGPGNGHGIYLYPAPATDFINIVFDPSGTNSPAGNASPGAWQIDLLAADGSLLQREYYSLAAGSAVRMNFAHKLAAGVYFIRAISSTITESYTRSFLIR
jgi:hypothetical protein